MSFLAVLRSEYTKMAALRSTRWTLLAFFVVTLGLGTLISWGNASHDPEGNGGGSLDPTNITFASLLLSQIAIAVLGVMTISPEYGTGAIRGTFTAVPRRWLVLTAKVVLVIAVSFVAGEVAAFSTWALGHIFWVHYSVPGTDLSDPGVLRAVIGAGLYITAAGLFGFALGALVRSTAGAVVAAVGGLLVAPIIGQFLPGAVGRAIARYLTSAAGSQIFTTVRTDNTLAPWAGFAVFCVWGAVFLAGAYVLVQRRDA